MDVEILSRIQFAFTIAFHYIYPAFSIGLGLFLVIVQLFWLKTRRPVYHNMARFWTRIFGLTFAIGVASGIVMEFEFGTNWATYSRFVGDVFGSPLAIEGLYAFFLESGFLAVLLFGWDKVGPYTHFFATLMVCLGSHFSAVWIVVANSWMQTPAGYYLAEKVKVTADGIQHPMTAALAEGTFTIKEVPLPSDYIVQADQLDNVRAVITDFWAMVFNPSSVDRLTHVVLGCWLAGAFLVISISAFYLLRKRHTEFAKSSLKIALTMGTVAALLQLWSADETARGVADNQPIKLAAIEGLAESQTEAPLGLFGIVTWEKDEEGNITGINESSLKVPGLLSILVSGEFMDMQKASEVEVKGLYELPSDEFIKSRHPDATPEEIAKIRPDYWPEVPVVFQTYHIMIACGMALIGITILGCILWKTGMLFKLEKKWVRGFMWILVLSVFIPQIANQAGWFTAEMGRQPWVVYEVLKTSEGLSKAVKAHQVLSSLIGFFLIYTLLFFVFLYTLDRKIKHGPKDDESIEVLPEKWQKLVKVEHGPTLDK
ncbi:cytochrome ubiquinol oxidase subunit I [Ruficoccus sp. ZRK36]|uniref:cytochrome ubiquinol oxidase subunit I n=1 Tax=Ruficoccus sp. ZRK36 TaxID=2866311 RepID=UPI001C73644E|nr:cytochrome ubiquinol oxidase subunit I [Ruficoccus sp. ZRK36]QYY37195.1 cytochrome ubiquinol oxidase subunit I [Ruficoccus sp. ZRK36]